MCGNPNRTQMLTSEYNSTRNECQTTAMGKKKRIINLSNIGK